jgi:hypothetical protein
MSSQTNILTVPPEIINLIFSFIADTKTYTNTRLVCHRFYDILYEGKVFENNKIKLIYNFDKENNKIAILNEIREEIGYVKNTYPCLIHSYLKYNDTTIEKKISKNEIITTNTTENNGLLIVKIDMYNIEKNTHSFRTLTKYIPNQNADVDAHAFHPHQLPVIANPNGCTIC